MKPGQCITKWWQDLVAGRLRTPQDIVAAARAEKPDRYEDRFTQDPEDGVVWTAPARLMAHQFLTSGARAKQLHRADWQNTDKRLRVWAARVVLRAEKWGVPLYVHAAYRGKDEQDALLKAGTSKTRYPKSAHNIGEAVDIVHGVYHWNLTPDEWRFIRHLAVDELRKFNATLSASKRLHLNWGGDDGSAGDTFRWDPAHWEIVGYRARTAVLLEGVPVHSTPREILSGRTDFDPGYFQRLLDSLK